MTDEKDFEKTHEKFLKHFTNGIIHKLILWIISKENIHGYGIMKKLEEFFSFEDSGAPAGVTDLKAAVRYIRYCLKWRMKD